MRLNRGVFFELLRGILGVWPAAHVFSHEDVAQLWNRNFSPACHCPVKLLQELHMS